MGEDFQVVNNEAAHRYEATVDGVTAELTYRLEGDRMVLTHTGVPSVIEGRGVGSALVRAAVADAIDKDLTIVPLCWFVSGWLERHPEVQVKVHRP